ncbi:MAG: PVC-type heme-binding CxxCH protein, partial [Gemmataceae bacterium]
MIRLSLLSLLCLPALALAQVPPEKAISTMTVADGLQIELFAAEPMLVNPTSIDVDHLGRVWVCEAVNYRRVMFNRPILRPEGDRIVILEDTKGVGKADKSTVFYQGKDLIAPIGICVAPIANGKPGACRVYVCQSPDILVFEDLDGDGKADGPPKKLLTGFKGFDHDHGVHGINIGPDGKLYFTVGDQGVDGLQSSDGKGRKWKSNTTDCRAGTVWRCDMDGKNLELIAHNFRNNYECCVNSFGEIWLSDNDDDGNQQTRICYVMPGGDYGYHPRGPGQSHWHEEQPGVVHKVLRTGFGSPTGICFYEGTLLPEKYRGQLLHCDAGPREFRCFHIKPKGAGYELEKELLVTSSDTWFRLSDVCVAPDGSVMLADWYDPGVGGHGMGDWTRGRIYRVTPKGHKGYTVPKVDLESNDGVIATLGSPCLATRYLALQRLMAISASREEKGQRLADRERVKPTDFELLQYLQKLADHPVETVVGARAMWVLCMLSATDQLKSYARPSLTLFQSDDARSRIFNIIVNKDGGNRSIFQLDGYNPTIDGAFNIVFPEKHESVEVLREVLIRVVRHELPDVARRFILKACHSYGGQDHFYRAALNIACGTDPSRRDAILADFDKHFPEWNDKVADLVWELRPKSVLPRLENLLVDARLTPAQKGRIVDILAVYDDPAAGQKLVKLVTSDAPAEVKTRAIDNLRLFLPTKWKSLKDDHGLAQVIAKLLESKDQQLVALQLAAAAPDCANAMDIDRLAQDASADRAVRLAAVRFLGQLGHVKYFHLVEHLAKDPVLAATAVAAMGNFVPGTGVNSGGKESLEYLGKLVTDEMALAELRTAAINALTSTRQGSTWLLKLKQNNQMPESLVADVGRLLRNSPFPDLRNRANLDFPRAGKLDPKKLPTVGVLAKRTGNAAKGQKLLVASLKGDA